MQIIRTVFYTLLFSVLFCCNPPEPKPTDFPVEKVEIDSSDPQYGYYLQVKPKGQSPDGVLVLLPGFGQKSEDIFLDTKLHNYAADNNFLTIGFAGGPRITADSLLRTKLTDVLNHVLQEHEVSQSQFAFGGFSAGGVIALRYAELCHQFPEEYPVLPTAVFMADSPVDLYHSWSLQLENIKNNSSEIAVNEAKWVKKFYTRFYGGTPSEVPDVYRDLSPFSIDKSYGTNEEHLKDVAIRAYHDVDIAWRITERSQTARFDNYISTSELILRLNDLGNDKATFIQSFKTGYRRDGERHPHSWSIVDAEECIEWIMQSLE